MEKPYGLKQKKIILRSHGILNKSLNASPNTSLQVVYQGGTKICQIIQAFAIPLFCPLLSLSLFLHQIISPCCLGYYIHYIIIWKIKLEINQKLPPYWVALMALNGDMQTVKRERAGTSGTSYFRSICSLPFFLTSKLRYLVKVRHMFKLHILFFLAW